MVTESYRQMDNLRQKYRALYYVHHAVTRNPHIVILLYNNVGLISKGSKDIASKALKIATSDTPLSSDALLQGTPADIRINVILPETTVTKLHFCWGQYGPISIQTFMVSSETHIILKTECVMAIQGRPRLSKLGPIKSVHATSY